MGVDVNVGGGGSVITGISVVGEGSGGSVMPVDFVGLAGETSAVV